MGGTVISGFEYVYDDLSNIVEETVLDKNLKMCYTYDALGRVTQRTTVNLCDCCAVSTETFSYDAAGNVTTDGCSAYVYDTNNRLTSYQGTSVSYDLDGNMLNNGALTCTYDSSNRLVSAGGHSYTYNAENVRIRNLCENEDTTYVYDTNCKLSKLLCKTTNGVTTKYVYGLGLIGEECQSVFKTYHFDFRGSTVAITDASGNITDTFAYDTYGKCISRTGTSNVIFGYNGKDGVVTDKNGLIYMRARYYSPELRRFANADIVAGEIANAITLNRFAYANGNPVSYIDPFGLCVERTGDAIWLQFHDLAEGQGHTGLLIQDSDGLWYLFSWGTTKPYKSFFGSNMPIGDTGRVLQKLGKYTFDLDNLHEDLVHFLSTAKKGKDLSEGLTGAIYFEGDFTKSIEYIEDIVDDLAKNNNQYNLYINNCLQVSMDALGKGTFEKYDAKYKEALYWARHSVIPNRAYEGMLTFSERIDGYMEKNWLQRIFSLPPYINFPSYQNAFI